MSRYGETASIFPFYQYLKRRKEFYCCCKFYDKEELQMTLEG